MLRRPLPAGEMRHARRSPSPDLSTWIAHYWMIQWDLRGCDPHRAESLPHPNVHVIFEPSASVVSGVHTQKFSRILEGQSQVFGIKFKPGAFRPFLKYAVSKLADRMVPMKSVLGKTKKDDQELQALQAVVLSYRSENEKVEAANAFFRARIPKRRQGRCISRRTGRQNSRRSRNQNRRRPGGESRHRQTFLAATIQRLRRSQSQVGHKALSIARIDRARPLRPAIRLAATRVRTRLFRSSPSNQRFSSANWLLAHRVSSADPKGEIAFCPATRDLRASAI